MPRLLLVALLVSALPSAGAVIVVGSAAIAQETPPPQTPPQTPLPPRSDRDCHQPPVTS
jgi:hypothetical protein